MITITEIPHIFRNKYLKNTGNSFTSSGGGDTTIAGNTFNPVYLWGQYFDDTENIDGDLTANGTVTALNLKGTNLDVNGTTKIGGSSLEVTTTRTDFKSGINLNNTDIINVNTLSANKVEATYLDADNGSIDTLSTQTIDNADTITTKNLTVTGKARFFELEIDKISAAGGATIFSPADGFIVEAVRSGMGNETLYFRSDDNDGKEIANKWKVGDQAICMTFNLPSNKYYWALVTAVSEEPTRIRSGLDNLIHNCHSITISTTDCDGEVEAVAGDRIAMLGHRGDDVERQSAIYISSYASLDTDLTAPFFACYEGINDFSLSTHRQSYFDANSAEFVGNFKVSSGKTIEQYIDDKINEASPTLYTYKAYAQSADGSTGFTTTDKSTDDSYGYVGICLSTDTTQPTDYRKYTWIAKGASGKDAEFYKLVAEYASATINDESGGIYPNSKFYVYQVIGDTSIQILSITNYTLTYDFITPAGIIVGGTVPKSKSYWLHSGIGLRAIDNAVAIKYTLSDIAGVIDTYTVPIVVDKGFIFDLSSDLNSLTSSFWDYKEENDDNITTIQNNVSTLQQDAESIAARVSQTETNISNITGEVGTIKQDVAQLKVRADGIESNVSTLTTEYDGLSDRVTDVESRYTTILQTARDISLSVNVEASDAVNLLKYSDLSKGVNNEAFTTSSYNSGVRGYGTIYSQYKGTPTLLVKSSSTNQYAGWDYKSVAVEGGKTYTFSVLVNSSRQCGKAWDADYVLKLDLYKIVNGQRALDNNGKGIIIGNTSTQTAISSENRTDVFAPQFEVNANEWTVITYTFKVPTGWNTIEVYPWVKSQTGLLMQAQFCRPMLNEGSYYYGWTPNTERLDSSLRRTGIDIEDGKITLDANNTVITGALSLFGTIRRMPIHINRDNFSQFVKLDNGIYEFTDEIWKYSYIVFDYFDGNASSIVLPYIYKQYIPASDTSEEVNRWISYQYELARELVGQQITIYNNTDELVAITGSTYQGTYMQPTTFSSWAIPKGNFRHYMCTMCLYNQAECVSWYTFGGASLNN